MITKQVFSHLTSMTINPSWFCLLMIGLMASPLSVRGEEILLHSGPPVSTPASTPVGPFRQSGEPKLIKFQREFFIDKDLIARLPAPSSEHGNLAITAIEAIKSAIKDIDPDGGLRTMVVTEVRLLKSPSSINPQVEYYLISTLANGSEAHRIVLMNGQVLTSKLRQIRD